ncbi:Fatty-acid and retinol-binding protein 7 [Aphelenchoides bicaudatus]|nr:Fatty-acid and retinol-binding protein 7 [Aphelenchoides bicaudatus]
MASKTSAVYLLFLALFTIGSAFLLDTGDMGSEVEEFIPLEVKKFYEGLNTEDRAVLQKVLSKASQYQNLSEVLHDLRNGSSTLYDKAVNIVTDVRATVAALKPPARKFVDETAEQVKRALGETFSFTKLKVEANAIVTRYQALDQASKDELMTAFPIVAGVVNNQVFQTLAAGVFGIGGSTDS